MKTLDFSNIELITGDDKEYHQELLGLYIHLFEEFPVKYQTQMLSGDEEKLLSAIHRAKPSLITLGLTELLDDLKQSAALLSQTPPDAEKIQNAVIHTQKYCSEVVSQLKKYQAASK